MRTVITALHTHVLRATTHLRDEERGSVSLEQVIITVAIISVAVLVVGAITAAVNNRIGGII